jgi:hypothetical protein
MLSLMSLILSICVPPMMLLLRLWLTFVLPITRSTLPSFVSSSESPMVSNYTVKPPVIQFYSHRGARLLDAPASSDELSSDVTSSFVEDVSSSPPVEPSSPTDSSLE